MGPAFFEWCAHLVARDRGISLEEAKTRMILGDELVDRLLVIRDRCTEMHEFLTERELARLEFTRWRLPSEVACQTAVAYAGQDD